MTLMHIKKTLFGKWKAIWDSGDRTFVHGYPINTEKKFDTLPEVCEWAKSRYYYLDTSPGGGIGRGVTLIIDNLILAEYYVNYDKCEVINEHFKHRGE